MYVFPLSNILTNILSGIKVVLEQTNFDTIQKQMSVQLGGVGANYIYQDYDKPYYPHGNTKLVVINCGSICVFLFTKAYYVWRNKQKDRVWKAMTKQEQDEYLRMTRLRGSRRLDFRFAH